MKQKFKIGNILFNVANYTIFALVALICVFPLYYIFVLTISNNDVVNSAKLLIFPEGIHFTNYVNVFKLKGLGQAAVISILRTVIGTALTVIASAFLGYLFSKRYMFARIILYRILVVTMYFSAGLIPWFMTMKNLHLTNNFLAYVIPYMVAPFYIILVKTYIENSIPPSMEDSAEIEGAGFVTVFTHIILPLSVPIIATIVVFESVNQWNNFLDNIFLMTDSRYDTLQLKLYRYLNEVQALANMMRESGSGRILITNPATALTATSIRMTVSMVVVFPILLVYPFLQKYYVKGIMMGAIKG